MITRSLGFRVVMYLVLAQLAAFMIGWVITLGLGMAGVELFATSWDALAISRAQKQVSASITLGENGRPRLVPTPDLQRELERAPRMKIAAFDLDKRPLAGSSPELVGVLRDLIGISPTHSHFVLPGDDTAVPLGLMEPKNTPYGRFHIAVYGQKFRWDDLVDAWQQELRWLNVYIAIGVLLCTGAAYFAMRRGLLPLRAVADEAKHVDMDTLDRRLTTKIVPTEVLPLVEAMNEALDRLDVGAARQRRFTANAAHELRTPVAILSARLDAPEEKNFRSDIKRDASRIKHIVEQLLATARAGEQPALIDERVDLAAIARTVVDDAALLAIRDRKQIEFVGPSAPVEVRADFMAIGAVIGNLVDNALRAEPEGGEVVVRVRDDGTVAVIDHGQGILESERSLIFEPFWRRNEKTPGAGLGLAITKEVVERHNGRIWVEATPGGGATFKLSLPPSAPNGS
jgi:signal transduction histidine kinase